MGQEEPRATPGSRSYSETVQTNPLPRNNTQNTQNKNEQRPTINARQSAPRNSTNGDQNRKTLLIGDSLLSGVNVKGLKSYVHCQPIPGATINKVKEKISMYDLNQFKDIIIYCGGNDSAESENSDNFKTAYEQLLQDIKNKNPDCKLYLCNSCPRGDTDTRGYNIVIKTLAESLGHGFVNAYDAFYDSNDELRTKFYGVRDWIHLSSPGTRRLLGTIHRAIPIVEDFRYCAYQQEQKSSANPPNGKTGRNQKYQGGHRQQTNTQRPGNRQPPYRTAATNRQTSQQPSRGEQSYYGPSYYKPGRRHMTGNNYYHREQTESSETENHQQQWASYNDGSQLHEDYTNGYQLSTQKERCTKCGLTNHTTYECHHKRQLLCYSCKFYGHKDSICWNQ